MPNDRFHDASYSNPGRMMGLRDIRRPSVPRDGGGMWPISTIMDLGLYMRSESLKSSTPSETRSRMLVGSQSQKQFTRPHNGPERRRAGRDGRARSANAP